MEQQEFCGKRVGRNVGVAQLGESLFQRGANVSHFFTLAD
jgi:hypothetical protein